MQCESCHEREATIAFTAVSGDHQQTLHLCPECSARQRQRQAKAPAGPAEAKAIPVHAAKVKKVNVVVGHLAAAETRSVACPGCGMTYEEFSKGGRLGCPRCYEAFGAPLRRLLKRIHGADHHVGRRPGAPPPAAEADSVAQLRQALNQAVKGEAYERAAELRDRIARLEEQQRRPRP